MENRNENEKLKSKSVLRRSVARLAAVQTIFQSNNSQSSIAEIVTQYHEHFLPELLAEFELDYIDDQHYTKLVYQSASRKKDIDAIIAPLLRDDWRLERLGIVERSVISVALIELTEVMHIPALAIITEYTALADSCGGDGDFINAILDRLARHYRPEEMSVKK